MTTTEDPLAVIEWPEGDEYRDPAVHRAGERFWWHESVARELERLSDLGYRAECVKGIAGNIRMSPAEVTRYVRSMLTWGELVRAEALHDFEPDTWVALAPEEITRRAMHRAGRRHA